MSDWLNPPYYTLPDDAPEYFLDGAFVNVRFAIDYGMGLAIDGDLKNPNYYFANKPDLDPQYHDPIAYARNLVAKAKALGSDKKYYAPDGWDPTESGLKYANTVFGLLKQIPVNRGDGASNNLFDSWVAGTGQEFGGHAPAPAPEGGTPATGDAPAAPGQGVTILGQPIG